MDDTTRRQQLADFLRTRRARLQPADVNLPITGQRRTPGLRREEVAVLAGISVDWYTWLEQGRDIRVSEDVLTSLGRVLCLSAAEQRYVYRLADVLPDVSPANTLVTRTLERLVVAQGDAPAFVIGPLWELLVWNPAACVLLGDLDTMPPSERNLLWLFFTSTWIRRTLINWEHHAQALVGQFREHTAPLLDNPKRAALVSALEDKSTAFAAWWADHGVQIPTTLPKAFAHPQVGRICVERIVLTPSEQPTLRLVVNLPDAASRSALFQALRQQEYDANHTPR